MDKKTIEEAISLLKEIRIISGINGRQSPHKTSACAFEYISNLIDEFKDEFKLKGFKK